MCDESDSEVYPRTDADRARLIRQIADTRTRAALLIERQERALIGQVVDEQRGVPAILQDADAQIDDVVRRQFRIECERVLRERAADVVRRERQQVYRPESFRLIADLRVAVADVLIDAGRVTGQ